MARQTYRSLIKSCRHENRDRASSRRALGFDKHCAKKELARFRGKIIDSEGLVAHSFVYQYYIKAVG